MIVAEDVLTSEEHLKLRVLEVLTKHTKSLPWILLQETKAGIEGRTAPALYGVVTDLIHGVQNRLHLGARHTGCN